MKPFKFITSVTVLTFALVTAAFADGHAVKKDIVDTAVAAGSFNTLVTAVKAADLVEVLKGEGPFTVFAPTDDAFAKVPADTLQGLLADKAALSNVLTYHVVSGKVMAADVVKLSEATTVQGQNVSIEVKDGVVYVDGAKVISADVKASNGVIHVIDSVILPKSCASVYETEKKDIVDTAVAAGDFTTLVTAVKAADLVEVLKGDGPFTVFAPNDAAFAKVPSATLQGLLGDKAALSNVLTYHVVAGKVLAADVVDLWKVPTVQGQNVRIEVIGDNVYVEGAQVIATDIEASNGVIHVIDSVILPE